MGDYDEERQENFEERIAKEALRKIDEQKVAAGTYYGLVPLEYQEKIEDMADDNFDNYRRKFRGDREAFKEAMSRNWLVKREAFAELAKATGMRFIESTDDLQNDPNETRYAILTNSASYLLVGEGAFDKRGKGASVKYVRIPLREGGEISDFDKPGGGYFSADPEVGQRARIAGIKTSRIMSMYALEKSDSPMLDSGSVTETFINVDAQTIY